MHKSKVPDITTNTSEIVQHKNSKDLRYTEHPCLKPVFSAECISIHPDFSSSFRTKTSLSDHFTDSSSPPSILSALVRTSNYTQRNWNSTYATFGFGSFKNQSAYDVTVRIIVYIVSRKKDENQMSIWFLILSTTH